MIFSSKGFNINTTEYKYHLLLYQVRQFIEAVIHARISTLKIRFTEVPYVTIGLQYIQDHCFFITYVDYGFYLRELDAFIEYVYLDEP